MEEKAGLTIRSWGNPSRKQLTLIMAGSSALRWRGVDSLAAREGATSVVRCAAPPEQLRHICRGLARCVLIADVPYVESLLPDEHMSPVNGLLGVRILAESQVTDQSLLERLLKKGCWGAVSPDDPARVVWKAVRAVAAGQYWVSREALTQIARRHILSHAFGLTSREMEILQLLAQGYRNHDIAEHLFITVETVRWHLRTLYNKLGVHDRFSAAMFASGLVPLDKGQGIDLIPAQRAAESRGVAD